MTTEVKFNISANDQATAALSKVNASIEKIQAPLKKSKATADSLRSSLANPATEKGLSKIGDAAKDVSEKLRGMSAPLIGLISLGSIAAVGAFATSFGKVGFEISNASAAIGVSTEKLQALRGAASLAGVGASELDAGLKSIGDTFQGAGFGRVSPETMGLMKQLNIEVHRLKDGSVDAARGLVDISRAMQGKDAARQRLIANTLGVGSLLPLLQKGPVAIEEFGNKYLQLSHVLSGPALEAAAQFEQKVILLHAAVDGLKNRIGDKLIPILSPLIEKFTDWIATISDESIRKFTDQIEALAGWIKELYAKFKRGDFDQTISDVKAIGTAFADVCGDIAKALLLWDKWRNRDGTTSPPAVKHFLGLRFGTKEALDAEERAKSAQPAQPAAPKAASNAPTAPVASKSAPVPVPPAVPPVSSVPAAPSIQAAPAAAKAPLGIRSNNPLNMQPGGQEAVYATPEDGIAAAVKNLQKNYSGLTLLQMINKWAPPNAPGNTPSATANYVRSVSQATGLAPNAMPNFSDATQVAKLVKAMVKVEQGRQPYSDATVDAGIAKAMRGERVGPLQYEATQEIAESRAQPGGLTDLVRSQLGGARGNAQTFQEAPAPRSDELRLTLTLVNAPAGISARAERKDGESVPVRILHAMPLTT